jgi:uncharacterized protein (TIGR02646 family)
VKFIQKAAEPPRLRRWKKANAQAPEQLRYANVPGPAREELRNRLLREQGYLCAYTMRRIETISDGHIEHISPQSRHPEKDVAYDNMLYCFPGAQQTQCDFGALKKSGEDVTAANFVSPLDRACEARFSYGLSGEAKATNAADAAALGTIGILNLNHKELVELRRSAVRGLPLFRKAAKAISAAKARRLVRDIMHADGAGHFEPFCIAVRHVAEAYAKQSESRADRVKRAAR